MKFPSLGVLVVLAAALFLTMACGGDDNNKSSVTPVSNGSSGGTGQSLKDYFPQLNTILTNWNDQSSQLKSQYPGAGSDPDQTRQYISKFLPVTANALSDLKSLNAPSTVSDRHDKLVSVVEDLVAAETSLPNDVASINDASGMKAYFAGRKSDFTAKAGLVNAACSDLQTVANNNNIVIALPCGGPASPAPAPVSGSVTPQAS